MNLPNKLTMLRIILIPLFIGCFYLPESWVLFQLNGVGICLKYIIAGFMFLGAYITDMFDGRIARKRNLITDFGKLMDPTADKLLTASAMIMLTKFEVMSFGNLLMPVFTIIIIAREVFISGIRQLAAGKGIIIAAKPIGKVKTTIQFAAILTVLLLGQLCRAVGIPLDFGAICVAVVITVWSGIDYTIASRELFRQR
ncbi:MAG: CDP-diacylglycerol--glycerol-3-phosphate 3-phosphatidyltransferase [Clostridia bacterium]|nr:CDP-diacylglycerol--glycerol-3-phosphate 3-phosphatidyltransferase [Clostridia bacterium]MBR6006684.1 CDP-diacylglycerol--glycerol-3-phosphate 3-phosphatidyltransferase [Clostridia bacterium]